MLAVILVCFMLWWESCDGGQCHLSDTPVWRSSFPKLLTESAVRLVDVNQDGFDDVIIGFATGADGYQVPDVLCDIYFNGTYPCFGGIMAINGVNGAELWRTYTRHEIFALNCNEDLNKDGVKDCVGGGRAAVMIAVDGPSGRLLWEVKLPASDLSNFYTPQFVPDLNGDGVLDILAAHGGDPLRIPGGTVKVVGQLMLIDGRTGTTLRQIPVPDGGETYYSPQVYERMPGSIIVLFGTGGETHGGSLWITELRSLLHGSAADVKFRKLTDDTFKGFVTPPVLVDINHDHVADIIVPFFNSTVVAFDGFTFKELWRYSIPNSETYSTPAPGYFNDDDIPDFFINYSVGPGYPIYYYAEMTVLDGRTGQPLLQKPLRSAVAVQASPLTLSVGLGEDYFLYWMSGCEDVTEETIMTTKFRFMKGTRTNQASRADICQTRFGTKGYSKLYALSQHTAPPGTLLFSSEKEPKTLEDTLHLAEHYLSKHPEWQLNASSPRTATKRPRRHVGAHDGEGTQRVISTGALAQAIGQPGSIDMVFATYWFMPTKPVAILEKDQLCIDELMSNEVQRFDPKNKYFGMDHDAYENMAEEECTVKRRGEAGAAEHAAYRDIFKLQMGSMTVHRMRLSCSSGLPIPEFHKQIWTAYMGNKGTSLS